MMTEECCVMGMVVMVGCAFYRTASRRCMEVEKVELVCVLHRLEGSQSLGGAREVRLMRGEKCHICKRMIQ